MGLTTNACPLCGKRGGLKPVKEFDGQKLPGSFCAKCSMFLPDRQSVTVEVSCESCKKSMGTVSVEAEVAHVATRIGEDKKEEKFRNVIYKGAERKKYVCEACSKARVEKGEHDVDGVLTRYAIHCGCGKIQGYNDHPEGTSRTDRSPLVCPECAARDRELGSNSKTLNDVVKGVVGGGT